MKCAYVLLVTAASILLGGRAAMADGLGGCCQWDGTCLNEVTEAACMAGNDLNFWVKDFPCGLDGGFTCHPRIGSCCNGSDCQSPISILECQCPSCHFTAGGNCADTICAIPTVSQWGLIVMTLLLLTGAKVCYRRASS